MSNFYLLYGPDKSFLQHELDKLLSKLKIKDIIRYHMATSSILDVVEDASTIGLFSSNKVIILEDCYFLSANKTIDDLEVLERYVKKYNPNNYCILLAYTEKIDTRKKIYKLLNENGKIIELKKVDQEYLKKYIEDILKQKNYQMEDINYFLDKTGSSLSNIQNELDKLMMYRLESKKIVREDIDKITMLSVEDEIFSLSDAIIAKDVSKSLKLLEEFLNKGYDEIQMIMLLASQFRFLFQVKRLQNKNKSEGEIAKILEVNPYRVKFTTKKLYTYSEDMLLEYIQKLAKMDHDIKLGIMDKKLALELFVIENHY
ncbi:MAG: DNA polymerase III subunit delta [Erysipelotrichaceae bacterium]|nr:DNA polymerase III subunit delta [Erysipelotrichaceae bacterium]